MSFVHLHLHTEYSLLDGAIRIKELCSALKELGQKAAAITDHGVMFGVIDFYTACVEAGIKPIIGCEVYTASRSRFDKLNELDSENGHLVLLVKNETGYKNLIKLVSLGFVEGFYYKPRIDMEILRTHSEGLIALSACLAGDVARALVANDYNKAREIAVEMKQLFGEDYYLELQDHGILEQKKINPLLVKLSKELEIPLVATNDAHYLKSGDAEVHDVLLCIQTGKTIQDENRMRFSGNEFYIKSEDEMAGLFSYAPESITNTEVIADKCNFNFNFDERHLPEFAPGTDTYATLRGICENGAAERYGADGVIPDNVSKRLDYELSVIKNMGFVDYFLIVWDFVRFARDQNIAVGPGRGSAAGSIAAYCLGITNVDPLKYNLLFERFLNPERVSMPDIDIDFCYENRHRVINYCIEKYGADRVSQIITFGTMAARAAIRDCGRALGLPYGDVDKIAKFVPFELGMTLKRALEISSELKEAYGGDNRIKKLIDTAIALEGMPRHSSTHAAGVVISKEEIYNYVPLSKNDDCVTTQFPMGTIEKLGLLKMDFLGLRTLTVIRDAIDFIGDKDLNIDKIGFDDGAVFALIGSGDTDGVFQLESSGMKRFLRELRPSAFEDIIAGISLYRPGPMDQIPRYIANKNNPAAVKYIHPLLKGILDVTYGCIVYQEQVIEIVRTLSGFSLGKADEVRRAMSKKKGDVMVKMRRIFIHGEEKDGEIIVDGAVRRGIPESAANEIFDEMMDFAKYAFNKSHAAAYAVIAYQTAYLKKYYRTEFMAALLTSILDNHDKVGKYIESAKAMGIRILPPDINESGVGFVPSGSSIRFGLVAVKNVGRGIINMCIEQRGKNGKFISLGDFIRRMVNHDINKRAVESLIKCGAFDFTGISRLRMLAGYEAILSNAQSEHNSAMIGQTSLFDDAATEDIYPDAPKLRRVQALEMEKEAAGLYLSGHPLDDFDLTPYQVTQSADLAELSDNSVARIAGVVNAKKLKTTKSGAQMAFITILDRLGGTEVIVFPKILTNTGSFLDIGNIVCIDGKVSVKEEEPSQIVADSIRLMSKFS